MRYFKPSFDSAFRNYIKTDNEVTKWCHIAPVFQYEGWKNLSLDGQSNVKINWFEVTEDEVFLELI